MFTIRQVKVSAPSRLHFGLFAVGQQVGLQFGGLGLMVCQPRTVISVSASERLQIQGAESATLRNAAALWLNWQNSSRESELKPPVNFVDELPVCLQLLDLPPRHQGFGTGTQIAFATALALTSSFGMPVPNAEQFALALDRGKRSAIGTYGFFLGGLLVDRGKTPEQNLSPLEFRTAFPAQWPIVIFLDRKAESLGHSGPQEFSAFEKLPTTPESHRTAMVELVQNAILSGLLQHDYERFGEGLFQFGRNSGLMFQAVQHGAYHSQSVAELVDSIRAAGVPAVGQSSWGPGVFAILPSREKVAGLLQHVDRRFPGRYRSTVTEADNQGVVIEYPSDR